MAKQDFQLILERRVGPLPEGLRARYDSLLAQEKIIDKLSRKLHAETVRWETQLQRLIPKEFKTSADTGYKITKHGVVYQCICACVMCQAALHGMSPTETVEAMVAVDAIPSSKVARARAEAQSVERQHRTQMAN